MVSRLRGSFLAANRLTQGYASLGVRALGFELTPKKFAYVCVAIAGKRIEDTRQPSDRIVTSELDPIDLFFDILCVRQAVTT